MILWVQQPQQEQVDMICAPVKMEALSLKPRAQGLIFSSVLKAFNFLGYIVDGD